MKILYVVRLFSGLEESFIQRKWKPAGVPTIYKMIEALDKGPFDLRLIFTCKDQGSTWRRRFDETFELKGLRNKVTVLAGECYFPTGLRKIRRYLSEIRQIWRIWQFQQRFRPDVIYIDHANLWAAGVLARHLNIPVVLRIMGVYPIMREAVHGKGLKYALMAWAYRAPYSLVVCTQDGSGVETWLDTALDGRVARVSLINGVNIEKRVAPLDPRLIDLPFPKTIVLFVGKLERAKGCYQFVEGFLSALEKQRESLHAFVVGNGSQAGGLRDIVAKHEAKDAITFIERLPHEQVREAQTRADIYISLNRYGNLSNANLEAMKAGRCMIIPASQPELGIDVITDQLVSEDAALRIPNVDDTKALCNAILHLHRNPADRDQRGKEIAKAAMEFIPSWEERIATEIKILQRIASRIAK
jgi:glycosyltransferase involved in cell wall biosynthesis